MDGQNQNTETPSGHSDLTPDQPVSLRKADSTSPEIPTPAMPTPPVAAPVQTAATPAPAPAAAQPAVAPFEPQASAVPTGLAPSPTPTQSSAVDIPAPAEPTGGFAHEESFAQDTEEAPQVHQDLTWTAAEFVAHPKTPTWYLALAGATAAVVLVTYVITRDIVTAIVIILCALLFGYMAGREPRQFRYGIGDKGITINSKFYPYTDFNGFAVIEEGVMNSIDFMPLKRFAPIMSINYDPTDEPRMLEILTHHLPYANHHRTMVDDLMHRIGF